MPTEKSRCPIKKLLIQMYICRDRVVVQFNNNAKEFDDNSISPDDIIFLNQKSYIRYKFMNKCQRTHWRPFNVLKIISKIISENYCGG